MYIQSFNSIEMLFTIHTDCLLKPLAIFLKVPAIQANNLTIEFSGRLIAVEGSEYLDNIEKKLPYFGIQQDFVFLNPYMLLRDSLNKKTKEQKLHRAAVTQDSAFRLFSIESAVHLDKMMNILYI